MTNENSQSLEEDLKHIIAENQVVTQETYRLVKKIHKHMVWDQVMSVVKIIIIVVPMVYGYYMIAPYLKSSFDMYKGLFGNVESVNNLLEDSNGLIQNLSPDVLEKLEQSGLAD